MAKKKLTPRQAVEKAKDRERLTKKIILQQPEAKKAIERIQHTADSLKAEEFKYLSEDMTLANPYAVPMAALRQRGIHSRVVDGPDGRPQVITTLDRKKEPRVLDWVPQDLIPMPDRPLLWYDVTASREALHADLDRIIDDTRAWLGAYEPKRLQQRRQSIERLWVDFDIYCERHAGEDFQTIGVRHRCNKSTASRRFRRFCERYNLPKPPPELLRTVSDEKKASQLAEMKQQRERQIDTSLKELAERWCEDCPNKKCPSCPQAEIEDLLQELETPARHHESYRDELDPFSGGTKRILPQESLDQIEGETRPRGSIDETHL